MDKVELIVHEFSVRQNRCVPLCIARGVAGIWRAVALLENQQSSLLGRRPDEVLALSEEINRQWPMVTRARNERQKEIRRLAGGNLGCGDHPEEPLSLAALLPYFPSNVAPMIRGLVEEVNKLIGRVSRFARQNQRLLARAVETTQTTLQALRPAAIHETYSCALRLGP
jgi:hypothetical protein